VKSNWNRTHPLAAALVEWNRERLATRVALGRLTARTRRRCSKHCSGQPIFRDEFVDVLFRETRRQPVFRGRSGQGID